MIQFEIIVDHGETANKCTIMPVSYREDFTIRGGVVTGALTSQLLLHPDGKPLQLCDESERTAKTVAAIDCVWRRLDPLLARLDKPLPTLVGIPEGFVTAYPRRSKKDFDPTGGLATIEALFIAAAFLGQWDESLMKEYFFADQFLKDNDAVFRQYGIMPPEGRNQPVFQPSFSKNAQHRRIGRGRAGL